MPYKDTPSLSTPYFQKQIFSKPIVGTDDLQVDEIYLQNRSDYAPQDVDTESSRNSGYYLVDEKYDNYGPPNSTVVQITRTYCQVPATRDETVSIVYNYPGVASGTGSAFRRYGARAPVSLQVNATDEIVYFRSTTGGGQTLPALTIPTLDDQPIDTFGTIYETTPPFDEIGITDPTSEPSTYTISSAVTRWKGQIWQFTTRTIPSPSFIFGG
jgi:hypothetical protein